MKALAPGGRQGSRSSVAEGPLLSFSRCATQQSCFRFKAREFSPLGRGLQTLRDAIERSSRCRSDRDQCCLSDCRCCSRSSGTIDGLASFGDNTAIASLTPRSVKSSSRRLIVNSAVPLQSLSR
jgi:hypothetical protein